MIVMMVAMDPNHCIGKDGTMPWHIPEELSFFKQKTMHHHILMGKRTWNHMTSTLPSRTVHILSTQSIDTIRPGYAFVHRDLQDILDQWLTSEEQLIVCGGASIYSLLLPYATELWISYLPNTYEGDTFFPSFHKEDYIELESTSYPSFRFCRLHKK